MLQDSIRKIELLAPARDLECGIAAINHGADAVYIGAQRFGARAAAGNSIDDIRRLCDYAHLFGARVYVTVNTILFDNELEEARLLLNDLQQAHVDAILVQDMALLNLQSSISNLQSSIFNLQSSIFNFQSSISFHASTQTDNRTVEKVRWLAAQGFSRVVLARELSVDEIAEIHRQLPGIELEVFVHGALCVSYSGQCYASQQCFGRSANRGECAQFCRMKFDLVDANGTVLQHGRHLLSLKDLNQSRFIGELIEAGASSLKIEGRLKDVAYVKNVTAAYSELLNKFIAQHPGKYERASMGRCTYTFTPDLRKSFNRGFTNYFLHGRSSRDCRECGAFDSDMASFDTPKAIGEFVGLVKEIRGNSFTVAGTASFSNGDGLCFLADDNTHLPSLNTNRLQGFRVNRAEGNRLFPMKMPPGLRLGMRLYRNNDQEMERLLSKPSAVRKIPVVMSLRPTVTGFVLTVTLSTANTASCRETAGSCSFTAFIEAEHVKAQTPQRSNIVRQLTKLGGTVYECSDVDIPDDFDYFIPSSLLAELRRNAIKEIENRFTANRANDTIQNTEHLRPQASPETFQRYSLPYLYNASNRIAREFYRAKGIDNVSAFEVEKQQGESLIMQCRHCLRHTFGFCVKYGGIAPTWHEPLSLRLGDGRRFRLEFDCKNCQMNVYSNEERGMKK